MTPTETSTGTSRLWLALVATLIAMSIAVLGATPAADAGDDCELCIEIVEDDGCLGLHNWKLCAAPTDAADSNGSTPSFDAGESAGNPLGDLAVCLAASDLSVDGTHGAELDEGTDDTKDDDCKLHNWKRDRP